MSGHRARKRFGQNFLRDPGVIDRIARAIQAAPGDELIEIGPGQGALTDRLATSGAHLTLIELDRDLVPALHERYGDRENTEIVQGDALSVDFSRLHRGRPLRVVGNLPYNISTPLLFHLLGYRDCIGDMHFMLQKEVVDRLAAAPNSKAYGRLSVMTQYHCEVESLFEVPPEAFSPRPKVTSAVVRLTPYGDLPHPVLDIRQLETVLRAAFNQRRKTLRNGLKGVAEETTIAAAGVDPAARPETLSLAQFVAIANALTTTKGPTTAHE